MNIFKQMSVLSLMLLVLAIFASQQVSAQSVCSISDIDLAANQKLAFVDFDQRGVLASTARKLSERGCYREAAKAGEHYLLFGPSRTLREQSIVSWHLGQNLAMSGNEIDAAFVLAASTRAPEASDDVDKFDWNAYVRGTWAFLVKRRQLLKESIDTLREAGGERNGINARVLQNLDNCFTKSYAEAYSSESCRLRTKD